MGLENSNDLNLYFRFRGARGEFLSAANDGCEHQLSLGRSSHGLFHLIAQWRLRDLKRARDPKFPTLFQV